MSPRSFAALVTLVLLLAGAAPAMALGAAHADPGAQSGAVAGAIERPHNSSLDSGDVEMRVDVAADGDAEWRVMTVVSVTDGDEREAFADLVDEFNETESPFALDTFRAGAENASDVTGRTMEIENVQRHHALHNETGALWITFTWTDFARTSGNRLYVDDAFNTSTGVWLPKLTDRETLVIEPPSGYGVSSAPTASTSAVTNLENGVARWEGPQNFGDRGPWIVYSGDATPFTTPPTTTGPTAVSPTSTLDGPTAGPGTSPGGNGSEFLDALPLGIVVVVAAASAAVLAVYMRRDEDDDGLGGLVGSGDDGSSGTDAGAESPAETESDGAAGTDSPADTDVSADDERAGVAAGAAAGAGADVTASAGDATDDGGIDEELLSDEERVERLIERNGGRMKQAAIVQETGWSNAKVSQLLSAMDDDDRIDKLRIGRENLISFPDEDVTDIDSE
ncbi:helix-turn-helix transcriptional regulator [Halosimplex salinum]|uniref:helix-turn-helix transcriptional regulator n=1 Tax=Halosimplex salinum TaxID=1710538 RepID=UPI001F2C15C6|nr:hypothetical protein [Halosimplex salinum]